MNEFSDSVLISIRLADGSFFPIIRRVDSKKCTLTMVPSRKGQERVDLQFFHHGEEGDTPRELGRLSLAELPLDGSTELTVNAEIGSEGSFAASVEHVGSGLTESAEFMLPENGAVPRDAEASTFPRIMGVVFVVVLLGLIMLATFSFAQWGRMEPEPAPLSLGCPETRLEIT